MLLSRPFCGNLPRTISLHACCLPFALDSAYNGVTTLVLPAFLRVNASSVHLFHGSTIWHYYLTQPSPLLIGPALPFDLHCAYLAVMLGRDILNCCFITEIWTSTVLSCAGHEELHFLYSFISQLCHGLHPPDQVDPYVSMIRSRNLLGDTSTSSIECDSPGHHGGLSARAP